jgi:hypothetical protein
MSTNTTLLILIAISSIVIASAAIIIATKNPNEENKAKNAKSQRMLFGFLALILLIVCLEVFLKKGGCNTNFHRTNTIDTITSNDGSGGGKGGPKTITIPNGQVIIYPSSSTTDETGGSNDTSGSGPGGPKTMIIHNPKLVIVNSTSPDTSSLPGNPH